VALTLVSELNVNDADVPLNFTTDTPVKPVPVIETFVPTGPLAGLNELTVGGLPPPPPVTVKLVALVPVPFGVVTAIGPIAAPLGTVALTLVSELNVNDADVPLNFTADTPVKPVPVIETFVPTGPLVGLKDETVGAGGGPPPPYRSRHVEPSFDRRRKPSARRERPRTPPARARRLRRAASLSVRCVPRCLPSSRGLNRAGQACQG
jgi:hypothetical protein